MKGFENVRFPGRKFDKPTTHSIILSCWFYKSKFATKKGKIMQKKRNMILVIGILTLGITLAAITGCSKGGTSGGTEEKKTIIFADAGWDSIRFHNDVAGFILEEGYGYKTDVLPGSTAATFAGFRKGDIDVYMEVWTENLMEAYPEAIEKGEILEVSINFDDNAQGLYVPTVIIEGDLERGIEPLAPDLKTVKDLEKYWGIFEDQEDRSKGRIYGSPPGWGADTIMREKVESYGLDKTFNYFSPGSDTGLSASIASAMERDQPWVGYYWEPTWILGKYDMTLLEEEPYDAEKWEDGYRSAFPPMPVTVCVYKDLEEDSPELIQFLSNYTTSSQITSDALAYMQTNDVETKEAAQWFLKEYQELWTSWVPVEVAEKVKAALN